jgi:hypothetical protein
MVHVVQVDLFVLLDQLLLFLLADGCGRTLELVELFDVLIIGLAIPRVGGGVMVWVYGGRGRGYLGQSLGLMKGALRSLLDLAGLSLLSISLLLGFLLVLRGGVRLIALLFTVITAMKISLDGLLLRYFRSTGRLRGSCHGFGRDMLSGSLRDPSGRGALDWFLEFLWVEVIVCFVYHTLLEFLFWHIK